MFKYKIKIFVDCHVFDKGFEGVRSCIQGLYEELIKEKHITFYLAAFDIENLANSFGEHENVFYIKYKSESAIYRLLFDIPKIIKTNNIDFAHFQYRVPPIKRCKYIVTIHDVLFVDFPKDFPLLTRIQYYYTFKFSAKWSDIVFTISNYSQTQINKHFKIKNTIVLPNGVDKQFFNDEDRVQLQKEIKDQLGITNYIIYISRFEPRKNQHLLLKYFIEEKLYLKHELVFIGKKTFEYQDFDRIYNDLKPEIKSKIKILENINFSLLLKLVKGAYAAVYPSRAEGFGIPPIESVAVGVKTICSNQTAMGDYSFFENYLFNPNDEHDFKRALNLVTSIEDKDIKSKSEYVKETYNWEITKYIFINQIIKYC